MDKRIRSKNINARPAVILREENIPLISLEGYEVVRWKGPGSYPIDPMGGLRIPAKAKKAEGEMNDGRTET